MRPDLNSRSNRIDRTELTTDFSRCVGLQIPDILMRRPPERNSRTTLFARPNKAFDPTAALALRPVARSASPSPSAPEKPTCRNRLRLIAADERIGSNLDMASSSAALQRQAGGKARKSIAGREAYVQFRSVRKALAAIGRHRFNFAGCFRDAQRPRILRPDRDIRQSHSATDLSSCTHQC